MVPLPTTETDEYERLYEESFRQLASLPVISGMPVAEAEELIDTVLLASLYRCRANPSQWLAAALTAAAARKEASA